MIVRYSVCRRRRGVANSQAGPLFARSLMTDDTANAKFQPRLTTNSGLSLFSVSQVWGPHQALHSVIKGILQDQAR
jgi:hypothetical protein